MTKINPKAFNFVGKRIDNGRLELLSILGSGAYGVVYLAFDTSSSPDQPIWYAVKCLSKKGLDARQSKFQRREIALHQLVSAHPGIVTLHRVVEEDDWSFVVLDFCPDGDLFAMITEQQVYLGQDQLIKSVFLQIISAVEYCHKRGIYHRDLKPENILCRNGGATLLLADFGLATSEKTSEAFGCGSSFYMSPGLHSLHRLTDLRQITYIHPVTECQGGYRIRGIPYSTRSNDVWALGVILVNLTCGRNPWKQATISDDTFCAYAKDPDFLRKILPVSIQCNEILKRIFTLNPQNRMTLPELRDAITNVKTFTMTEDELQAAHTAVRKVVVQQHKNPVSAAKIPDVVVEAPRPIDSRLSTVHNRTFVAAPFEVFGSRFAAPPSPTATRRFSPSPAFRTGSHSSSDSDGSVVLTPEVQPVHDEPLAAVPEADLDGDWETDAAVVVTGIESKNLRSNPLSEKTNGSAGRNFLSNIARKIRAL